MIDEKLHTMLSALSSPQGGSEGGACVIFDLDGTLYNKRLLPLRMVLADWRHLGLLRAERSARKQLAGKYFGSSDALYDALFKLMAQQTGKSLETVRTWYNQTYMPTMVRVLRKHYTLTPFAREIITYLQEKGIRIAIFSDYGCVQEKLEAIGFFDSYNLNSTLYINAAPEMGGLKPCKEAFENLLNTLQLKPENALMIGDRDDTDGAGAASVGMPFYQVKY